MVTKLYVATDSNPVDVHTYELCSDLVDVIIDVSYVYGTTNISSLNSVSNHDNDGSDLSRVDMQCPPYDSHSASVIRLNSGMILYLRAVSNYLALVCVLRDEYFLKRSLLDYNIDCFTSSLNQVFIEVIQQSSISYNTSSDK